MKDEVTPTNDPRTYVGYDLYGFPYNSKYLPNKEKFGDRYEGYSTKARGVLLYDFAVMGYDVKITYKGKIYYLLNDGKAYLSDEGFTKELASFDSPMALIENLTLEGTPLVNLLDIIEDIEPM